MVFSTPIFLFYFLVLTLLVYYLVPRKLRNGVLLISSNQLYRNQSWAGGPANSRQLNSHAQSVWQFRIKNYGSARGGQPALQEGHWLRTAR